LALAASAAATTTTSIQFGLYDADLAPDGGWKLMDAADWQAHSAQFVSSYNSNEGIDAIAPFKTQNCCIAIAGGKKLTIQGTAYGMQFPAATSGGIRCNPTAGYTEARYTLYKSPKLAEGAVFGAKSGCATGHNPGIFMRQLTSVATTLTDGAAGALVFGMFDLTKAPAGGWQLMTSADFEAHKEAFVEAYNANGGFSLVKSFQSGNCCIAVKGGNKLTISGSSYGYQFPASTAGGIRCNPTGGYSEAVYQFYRMPTLTKDQTFGEKSACSTDHNPAVYMLQKAAATSVEFGLFDAQTVPAAGWQLMSAADMTAYKSEFVNTYNSNGGINVIKPFQSGNCCVAVRNGLKLTITGTAYGYQFPAAASGGIRCNPTGGYTDPTYRFYKAETLKMTQAFGEKAACTVDHNPGLYFRGATSQKLPDVWDNTPAPTQAIREAVAVHCKVTDWSSWSSCSARCGEGVKFRVRSVRTIDQNGGDQCPPLREDAKCVAQDCPVHCEVGDWKEPTGCNAECGGGFRTYARTVTAEPNHTGDKCPHLTKQEACNTTPCKVHCTLSDWSGWEECNAECGGGQERRVRKILVGAEWGGDSCDTLMDTRACNTKACPVHCTVSDWSVWSDCSQQCGTGSQERMRLVTRASSDGGSSCPPTSETRPCNTSPCPIDCVQTGWSDWSECSKSCGTGTQKQTNKVLIKPQHGGKSCTAMAKTQDCKTTPCAVDCVEGTWQPWDDCDQECGVGTQKRVRTGDVTAQHNGLCSDATETRNCEVKKCKVHCEVSIWGGWSKCSDDCGGGYETRTRSITQRDDHNGDVCGDLVEKKVCNTHACPIDCVVTQWGAWNQCSQSCGGGTRQKERHIKVNKNQNGKECPTLIALETCNDNVDCPEDCKIGAWPLNWSECSAQCGEGTQTRKRTNVAPKFGGKKCPSWTQTQRCNNGECPVGCETSEWGTWTSCDRSCGKGETVRHRTITKEARHGGVVCPDLTEKENCETIKCPVDCIMNDFGPFSECSHDCGGGSRSRSRTVARAAAHLGKVCPSKTETRSCNMGPCAVHCTVTSWNAWSTCSKSCNGGHTKRTRDIVKQAQYGGFICPTLIEHQECGVKPCPIDCAASPNFSAWSACSQLCGAGKQTRTKSIITAAVHNGAPCDQDMLTEQKDCLVKECAIDCVVKDWNLWSKCSVSCGTGTRWRRRTVARAAEHGGTDCPHLEETEKCSDAVCPINCEVSLWSTQNEVQCSKSCGGGHMLVTRTVTQQPHHSGKACPALSQYRKCNTHACARDCQVTSWGIFGGCSSTCRGGKKSRSRTITHDAANGGKPCPPLTQEADCNTGDCPTDCTVSDWGSWSMCTTTCGKGAKWRERTITQISKWSGHHCPELKEDGECEERQCPINCKMSDWSLYAPCTKSCGDGVQVRTRTTLVETAHQGTACPAKSESKACNRHACPIDCSYGSFGAWSACSETCGIGKRTRARKINTRPQFGGKVCPNVFQTAECNSGLCPIHCSVSSWAPWGRCTKTCGTGVQSRTRIVVRHAHHGGYQCPELSDQQECNLRPCPVHCEMNAWSQWSTCTKTCNYGVQTRSRTIKSPLNGPAYGGKACPAQWEKTACASWKCAVNCEVTEWGQPGKCSKECGSGIATRTRKIKVIPQWQGHVCPALEEHIECNSQACAVDCSYFSWGSWSSCSASCGSGTQQRFRTVATEAAYGGKACANLHLTSSCSAGPCPVHCEVSAWTAWDTCSAACGYGQQQRTRTITTDKNNGGDSCPDLNDSRQCMIKGCPVDCVPDSVWDDWSGCTKTCGGGRQTRTRGIKTQSRNGGLCNDKLYEEQACGVDECPVDCELGDWGPWGACSVSCKTGTKSRKKSVISEASNNGRSCTSMQSTETVHCNAGPCPVNCDTSAWGGWGGCSAACGNGSKTRSRSVVASAKHGGYVCPNLEDVASCSLKLCPVDCVTSELSGWSSCSVSCGKGTQTRSRRVVTSAVGTGKACPGKLVHTSSCNLVACVTTTKAPTPEGSPIGLARPAATPMEFRVKYQTGWHVNSGSQSEMQVGFVGTYGRSNWYSLGSVFPANKSGQSKVAINEDVGLLRGLAIRAKGVDGWNPVNFINVVTPRGHTVQFKANYFIDMKPHDTAANAYGVYPFDEEVGLVAINKESGDDLATGQNWQVAWKTADTNNAGTTSRVYAQFHGQNGASRFYSLGNSFVKGQAGQATVSVTENIGYLRKVTLLKAGQDSWTAIDAITVTKGANTLRFPVWPKAGFTVTSAGKTFAAASIEAGDAKDMTHWWGDASGRKEEAPTVADPAWDKLDHSRTAAGSEAPTNGVSASRATGVEGALSTLAPTAALTHCANGPVTVPDGWTGAGHKSSANYCNMCACSGTTLTCTKKACGAAAVNDVTGWSACDKVGCAATKEIHGGKPHWVIAVKHDHSEHMKKHVCTFNKYSKQCTCKCKAPYTAYTQKSQHGAHTFAASMASGSACEIIHFKQPYNPARGDVHITATASFAASGSDENDATRVWVQSSTFDRFTLCARSPFAYRHKHGQASKVVAQYYAYQGATAPWGGAAAGATVVQGLATSKVACQTISFGKTYAQAPMVIGTVDYFGNKIQQHLTSWVEDVNAEQFRVCFHNEGQLAAAASAKPRYNWIAFEHANPSNWFTELPYSMGGRVAAGAWSKYAGTWHEAARLGVGTWSACQTVEFGKTFTSAPTVLVTANHEDDSSSDWSHAPHPETQTWVDAVSASSFKVCSTERGPASGDRDNSLKWDWVAFGEDSIAIAA
jgi:hypothetical protein